MGKVSNESYKGKHNTCFMFNNFPPPQNLGVCEIIWKNMVELDRPQMTIKDGACALCAG